MIGFRVNPYILTQNITHIYTKLYLRLSYGSRPARVFRFGDFDFASDLDSLTDDFCRVKTKVVVPVIVLPIEHACVRLHLIRRPLILSGGEVLPFARRPFWLDDECPWGKMGGWCLREKSIEASYL